MVAKDVLKVVKTTETSPGKRVAIANERHSRKLLVCSLTVVNCIIIIGLGQPTLGSYNQLNLTTGPGVN